MGVASRDDALLMIYILIPAALIATVITFIYFILNSSGPSRKKAIGALLGILLMFLGHLMDSNLFNSLIPSLPDIICPIVLIIGVIFFTASQLFNR